jgi:7-cyano-7-deazaguanine synthase
MFKDAAMDCSRKAVVLLSGGLDSKTCLAIARAQGYECYAISFDYGQKTVAELQSAEKSARELGAVRHEVVTLDFGRLGGSALTDSAIVVEDYKEAAGIPATYVPARNSIFLSIALGWAEIIGAEAIFAGVCSTDHAGYPDCRPEYIAAFQKMALLATKESVTGRSIEIITPLLYLSKAETIKLGLALGVNYQTTCTCYRADEAGRACGSCDSCVLRRQGFIAAGVADPTVYFKP